MKLCQATIVALLFALEAVSKTVGAACDPSEYECIPFISEVYSDFDQYAYNIGMRDEDNIVLYNECEGSTFYFGDDGSIRLVDRDNNYEVTNDCLQAGHGDSNVRDGTIVRVKECNSQVASQRFVLEGEAFRGGEASIVLESNRDLHVVYSGTYPPQLGDRIIIKDKSRLEQERLAGWGFD